MKKRAAIILLLTLLAGGLSSYSQTVTYGPFVPTAEWGEIMREIGNTGTRASGIAKMRALAAREKGTTMGAHALAVAGTYSEDPQLYRQMLEQIITDYPNSTFSLQAQIARADLTPQSSTEAWMAARNQLLQGFGAPTVGDVFRNRRAAVLRARALPADVLTAIMPIYLDYGHLLRKHRRYREAITLGQFGTEVVFDKQIPLAFDTLSSYSIYDMNNGGPYDVVFKNPQILVRSPRPNRSSGSRPYVRFDVQVGDYTHAKAGFAKVWLDGQEISSSLELQTKLNLKRKTGPNVVYENQRYSYRPMSNLAQGRHTVAVSVTAMGYKPGGPGKTETTWSFFVERGGHDGDDEDDCGPNDED